MKRRFLTAVCIFAAFALLLAACGALKDETGYLYAAGEYTRTAEGEDLITYTGGDGQKYEFKMTDAEDRDIFAPFATGDMIRIKYVPVTENDEIVGANVYDCQRVKS